jgi:L-alanine-DL-glutamate epimerase-like enolase superfamily enzyme
MGLWDLCAKACGQPVYRLFGGAVREEVDYFYYLRWATPEQIEEQCREGVERGYSVFYLKVGVHAEAEEAMLAAVRRTIGAQRKIRIDANQAWTVPEAARLLADWHRKFELDFVEAPVPIDPPELMLDLKRRVPVPLCVNEGLWREADASRIIDSRCGDYLCFSSYWVGSLRRFQSLAHAARAKGWQVCKHTHGELGLAAAAGQHLMLTLLNACDGHQQTAQFMAADHYRTPMGSDRCSRPLASRSTKPSSPDTAGTISTTANSRPTGTSSPGVVPRRSGDRLPTNVCGGVSSYHSSKLMRELAIQVSPIGFASLDDLC